MQQFEGTERIDSHKKINASHVLEVIKFLEERSQKTLIYNDKILELGKHKLNSQGISKKLHLASLIIFITNYIIMQV